MASLLLDCGAKSSSSFCRSCRTSRLQARSFSSASARMVGPESPNFIDIPRSLQPGLPSKPRVKGILPVPRELFPARRPDKPSEAYIAAATPEPSADSQKPNRDHPHFEHIEWKRKMAIARRKNLRQGLLELYRRKEQTNQAIAARSNSKQSLREQILRQDQREDERLTTPTTLEVMKPLRSSILPNPNGEERLARSIANFDALQAQKLEHRQDALHTLYVNAREFITTEDQLLAEIERVFPAKDNPDWTNDQQTGDNIWNLGVPPTVESMVSSRKSEVDEWDLVQRRVKKIAEELTGGKI